MLTTYEGLFCRSLDTRSHNTAMVDETDYPCSMENPDKLYDQGD